MVLRSRGRGRVGRRQLLFESPTKLCLVGLSAIRYGLLADGSSLPNLHVAMRGRSKCAEGNTDSALFLRRAGR